MNPTAYCFMVTSCSEKDWEVFGAISLIVVVGLAIFAGVDYLITKFGKDKDMK